jgi:hypothetical protein
MNAATTENLNVIFDSDYNYDNNPQRDNDTN